MGSQNHERSKNLVNLGALTCAAENPQPGNQVRSDSTSPDDRADILLVDDREDKLLALETILAELGQNLVLARSGSEALRLLLQRDFAVIVLDVNMPGMDGFETAVLIRQRQNSELTPIIFISAVNYSEVHLARGYSLGAIDYILAPIVPEILRAKVSFFVDLYKKTEQLKQQAEIQSRLARAEAARAEAEAANSSKDRFLAMLSHELRMPLTPILFSASMLSKDERLPPDARKDLESIAYNVQVEARLIDDLLDVARISQGKLSLTLDSADIRPLIDSALSICAEDLSAKNLTVHRELKAADPTVRVDAARISQVFWNLVQNAVKFTPPHGRVTVRVINPEQGWLRVEVIDTGIGIAPEALPRIFDPFEQVESGRSGGLGLGLAVSKAIVELHGGKISASSEGPQRGSRFVIELPNILGESGTGRSDAGAQMAPAPDWNQNGPKRHQILLVDDHNDTAEALRNYLGRAGYDVTVAASIEVACQCVEQQCFDLLLCDIGLPDGRGDELLLKLRRAGYEFPAIALSGFGAETDVARSRAAGFHTHLTKPFSPQQLKRTVEEALRGTA
ncbi:MAG: response regulator [Verrucomicrobia bacterium]|nr:response regulator [Verrucomicrobiota bacterium]